MIGSKPRQRDQVNAMAEAVVGLQSPTCPFLEYLRSEVSQGKTEFRLVVQSSHLGGEQIYIHPLGKDGVSKSLLSTHSGMIDLTYAPAIQGDSGSTLDPVEEKPDLPEPGTV